MKKTNKQIKVSRLFWKFASVFLILGAGLLVIGALQVRNLSSMQEITEDYLAGQEANNSMREASDFLTEKARSFAASGNEDAARAFFEEVNETKRREKALKDLGELAVGREETRLTEQLANAVNDSYRLAEIETYAMRLAAEGYGSSRDLIDDCFPDVELSAEDLALTKEEQIAKAIDMVFNEQYEKMKSDIIDNVQRSSAKLTDKTRARQADSYKITARYSRFEYLLVVLMLVAIFSMMIVNSLMIVSPLRKGINFIRDHEPLPVKGAEEYAYLAETYNGILETTKKQNKALSYEATHDEITGIYNRKMFETVREELKDSDIALLLLDVDLFKGINDRYGHQTGDLVLKTTADILLDCFRAEDYVCRIGGDEFAVIMVSMKPELEYVVRNKIEMLRKKIAHAEDIPEVTVSIGVAYSHDDSPEEDLFRKADRALYTAKENGRNGFAFYKGE